jgi:hypothetical protein
MLWAVCKSGAQPEGGDGCYQEFIYPWATLNTRIWKGSEHVESEWTAGPIPILDRLGKELVVRLSGCCSDLPCTSP